MAFINKLEEILKKASVEKKETDFAEKILAWRKEVEDLYKEVEGWLSTSISKNYVKISKKSIEIKEELTGSYLIDALELVIGTKVIRFQPVGMHIIGSRGRVDIIGPKGQTVILLLLGENEVPKINIIIDSPDIKKSSEPKNENPLKLIWKVAQKSPRLEVFPLTEKILVEILEQILQ